MPAADGLTAAATNSEPRSAAVQATGLSHSIGKTKVLSGLELTVAAGELVALVGPSGSGKSTLLDLVCGLRQPTSGTLNCVPAALMPQKDMLLPWLSARDNIAIAYRLAGASKTDSRAQAEALLREVGLQAWSSSRPDKLSGGMRQRVSFLRALATEKELLCLDEPFASLDAITRGELRDWLGELVHRRQSSVLLVTHDSEEAALLADRVIVLSPRPAKVAAEFELSSQRPRSPEDPQVIEIRKQIHLALATAMSGAEVGN